LECWGSPKPSIDLVAEIFERADEVQAGIGRSSPPLWPMNFEQWFDILAAVEAFERSIHAGAWSLVFTRFKLTGSQRLQPRGSAGS
jgi:hypothetical protein